MHLIQPSSILRAISHLVHISPFRCQFEVTEKHVDVLIPNFIENKEKVNRFNLLFFFFTSTFHPLKSLVQCRNLSVAV